jgi:putative flippase GtrA
MSAGEFTLRLGAAAKESATWKQLLKFGLVGGSGYLVNLAVFAALADVLGAQHTIASLASFAVAVTNNFIWNRHWTFGPGDGQAGFQAARFFVVSLAALGLNLVVLEALLRDGVVGELAAQAIAVAVATPFISSATSSGPSLSRLRRSEVGDRRRGRAWRLDPYEGFRRIAAPFHAHPISVDHHHAPIQRKGNR